MHLNKIEKSQWSECLMIAVYWWRKGYLISSKSFYTPFDFLHENYSVLRRASKSLRAQINVCLFVYKQNYVDLVSVLQLLYLELFACGSHLSVRMMSQKGYLEEGQRHSGTRIKADGGGSDSLKTDIL